MCQKHIKKENSNILCLQAFNLAPKNWSSAFGNPHCRHSPGKEIVVSFTRKSAVLRRQIKPKLIELRIKRRQSNLNTAFIFVSCEGKDSYRIVSVA